MSRQQNRPPTFDLPPVHPHSPDSHLHDPDAAALSTAGAVGGAGTAGRAGAAGAGGTAVRPAGGKAAGAAGRPARPGFWASLAPLEQAAFIAAAHEAEYPLGEVLWREGDAADHLLVIRSGAVRICVDRDGGERIVAFRGPGDIIGERAALLLRRRSATVVAVDTVRALWMTTQEFAAYLTAHTRVVAVVEKEVYDRLTERVFPSQEQARATAAPIDPYAAPIDPYTGTSAYAAVTPYDDDGVLSPYAARAAEPTLRLTPSYAQPKGAPGGSYATALKEPPARRPWAGHICSIMFVDIASFSAPYRNDIDRLEMRRIMYELLWEAFAESGVPWDECHREDRGDGALIVVPPETPVAAVEPVVARLAASLRRHNQAAQEAVRIQLRMALHVGPVTTDPQGVSGSSVIHAARLLDARPLRQRLAETRADLGFVASAFVYESVLAHAPGHDSARYAPFTCRVKESRLKGWMRLAPDGRG
ncbi:cyclic nucleotide-binding domain-containing protein [Actinomadura violacea]|uniref:Cyclic nucleotide-binding domain-containing protein n=1 Tax=Actinomadura violacea TaxID=2819934 RepID=A0ABS3S7W4_9ACTN|nr:cyclic nucleotide-binding domain-containing protein [Actinomadura violacea]MBO2465092.1 cyclic nucleotide-binding domain-containing protein [Actinomadura violacea]